MNNSTIKENEIYRGRICRFTHNEVTFEDGSTGYRDVLHLPGAVAVLAKDDEGNIFFVEQFRHAVMESLLELPAGMLEKGEDPVEAALRELEEETGYKAHKIEFLCSFFTSPGVVNEKIYLYTASQLERTFQHLDEDEFLDFESQKVARETELVTMLVFDEVGAIVGVDEKVYGPFRPQDIVTLPLINAKIFFKNRKGRKVKI